MELLYITVLIFLPSIINNLFLSYNKGDISLKGFGGGFRRTQAMTYLYVTMFMVLNTAFLLALSYLIIFIKSTTIVYIAFCSVVSLYIMLERITMWKLIAPLHTPSKVYYVRRLCHMVLVLYTTFFIPGVISEL